MIRKILILAALVAIPTVGGSSKAQAVEEYCREYTKTVSVGGRSEQAYGTACYRPDGSWEIVDLEGSNYGREQVKTVMYDDLQRDYRRNPYREVVVVERHHSRPYYSGYNHRYHQAHYSPFVFNFGFGDRDYDNHKKHYKKHYKKAKYNKHHKHHDHGRGGHR